MVYKCPVWFSPQPSETGIYTAPISEVNTLRIRHSILKVRPHYTVLGWMCSVMRKLALWNTFLFWFTFLFKPGFLNLTPLTIGLVVFAGRWGLFCECEKVERHPWPLPTRCRWHAGPSCDSLKGLQTRSNVSSGAASDICESKGELWPRSTALYFTTVMFSLVRVWLLCLTLY